MASAPPPVASTKETTNYARLCRLLVDVGSQALRDTFDRIYPQVGLHLVLGRHPAHRTLQSLRTRKILNPTQWGKLYPTIPSSVSSASFDITLLMVLLRNICGLTPPHTGWDNLPPAADVSVEANIARVKYYRNTVYGHASQASVDEARFNAYWQDISNALVGLGGASYGAAINKLKNECMDPDTKEHYRELLKQWKKDEDSIKDKLEEIEDKIRIDFEQMKSEIGNMSDKLDTLMAQSGETKDEESTKEKLEEMKVEIANIDERLDSLMKRLLPAKKKPGMEDVFDPAKLIDGIRQLYKLREGWLAPFPWCEEFHFRLDDIYTRLKVVSRKKTRGTATNNVVNVSGIFKQHEECSKPRTVLIEGKPGMGKTTYCKKLVYDWATGKQQEVDSFPRFEAVLLLRCRDMKSDLWEAIDDQLLPRDVEEDVRERFFNYIRHNQSNILLILDGLDEVPASTLLVFSEIIQGRVLQKCRVVATARHEAGMKVRIHCDTLLEIEGFTVNDANKFIVKYFKAMEGLAQKLLSQVRNDKNLKDLAANPLNTALLCLVCEEFQGIFPESRTQLYVEIVRCILRRYRKKKGLSETSEDLIKVYETQLKHLGWIALNGLREDNLDFEESELESHADDLPGFGFLSVQPGGSKLRPRRHYSFLHKSFQEWFAAFYLCCQLLNKEISADSLAADRRYLHELKEVLSFTCGMVAARCEETAVALIKSITTQVNNEDAGDCLSAVLDCIKECRKDNSNFYVKLARVFGSFLELQTLNLSKMITSAADVVVLAEALKENSTLTGLNLSSNNTADHGAACLAEALKKNLRLKELNFSYNCIGDHGAAVLAEALKENSILTNLNLSNNYTGYHDAANLAEALKKNSSLKDLNLSCNCINDHGAAGLAEALKENSSLTKLDLSYNRIGDDGAAILAEALKENTSVTKLDLSHNNIGGEVISKRLCLEQGNRVSILSQARKPELNASLIHAIEKYEIVPDYSHSNPNPQTTMTDSDSDSYYDFHSDSCCLLL